ncbi:MAG: hypothetical protein ACPGDD_04355 [Poseidonia sp.]
MKLSKVDAPVSLLNTGAKVVLPFVAVVLGVMYLSGTSTDGAGTLCECSPHLLYAVFIRFAPHLIRLR